MNNFVYLEGEQIEGELPLRSFLYGEGLFETFRWNGAPPVFLDRHLKRMKRGAELLDMPFPRKSKLRESAKYAVEESDLSDAYVKICLLSSGALKFFSETDEERVMVIVREYEEPQRRMRVHVSQHKRSSSSPVLRIKAINYLDNILARRDAMKKGYDEAIFLNEREGVAEGSSANIFWIEEDTLYTPTIECGLLPGITRELLISLAPKLSLEVEEERFGLNEVLTSEGAFFTNSLMGIAAITEVDETEIAVNEKLFEKLRKTLFKELEWDF